MKFSDRSHNLRIELDTKNFDFSAEQLDELQENLAPMRDPVRDFPVSDLYITVIYHHTPDDYHVRTSLVLPKRTLFTGERDPNALTAFGRCVRKLVAKLTAYKDSLSAKPERAKVEKGTAQKVVPTTAPDADQLREAVESGNYAEFRRATYPYEEPIRKRAGRWIERYPRFELGLGARFTLADLVEEVFLNAFEQFDRRPDELRLGEWLEELIDPSVKALLHDPDAELDNIEAVRSYREAAPLK